MKPFFGAFLLAGLLAGLPGCATSGRSSWPRTGDPLVDGRTAIEHAPPEDKVLWQYRTALVAMRRGQYEEAKTYLDDALLTIGGVIQDPSAKKARGMFSEESGKVFRGEPYERVMAYYYRGILYWMDGEPDNARACFRSAQIQDSDTENNEFRNDYVLLEYLDGLASRQLAADGSDAFKRAQAVSRLEKPPTYPEQSNTMVFLEFGQGPMKYASGQYNQELRFKKGSSRAQSARITVAGGSVRAGPYDDLSFQATTRGGRVMDHVLHNKAVFKSTTDTVGNVALVSGAVMAGNRQTQEIGLGLLAAGLLGKAIAAATVPNADTRGWTNLPQYLSFAALDLPPGQHELTVEFLDADGNPLRDRAQTRSIQVLESGGDTVLFVSDQS